MDVCIYQPLRTSRMQHKVNFLRGVWQVLNSEFSFFQTGYHTKVKKSNLPYYFPIPGRIIVLKGISAMQKDSNSMMITIIRRAPLYVCMRMLRCIYVCTSVYICVCSPLLFKKLSGTLLPELQRTNHDGSYCRQD